MKRDSSAAAYLTKPKRLGGQALQLVQHVARSHNRRRLGGHVELVPKCGDLAMNAEGALIVHCLEQIIFGAECLFENFIRIFFGRGPRSP